MCSLGVETARFGPAIITVDVEDWPQSTWDASLPITQRAADNTRRVMAILEDAGARATLFVLGKFAVEFPNLVREMHACGHEIASHGYGHVEINSLSRDQFAEDIWHAKDLLEQIIGAPVRGYRAPDFSIGTRSLWALEVLVEAGYEYDSSIFPVNRPRYGIPSWPRFPTRVVVNSNGSIVEFPIATFPWLGRNWPIGGGGYHRLLPGWIIRWATRRVLQEQPVVFYCHPYEFDPNEFSETCVSVPLMVRLHQGLGRKHFEHRFRSLLRQFGSRRIVDLLDMDRFFPEVTLNSLDVGQD